MSSEQWRRFAQAPTAKRKQLLQKLPDRQVCTLAGSWHATARKEQLPPPGDWRLWLICAGRGFGKTRSGAEWVNHLARTTPPATPAEGDCWLVGSAPIGEWAGKAAMIACRQTDAWLFAQPRNGMGLLDESSGQTMRYANGWQIAPGVTAPTGGSVVDAEARTAINGLIAALRKAGIIPTP